MDLPDERYRLIVILDDNEFDGFAAAKGISENDLSSSFIMLMISTNDKKRNYVKCMTMGIDNYLIKPFGINELLTITRNSFPFVETKDLSKDENKLKSEIKVLVVEDNKMSQKVIGKMLNIL